MVFTVRKDLYYENKRTVNNENIQKNAKIAVNKLVDNTNNNKKRKVLQEISQVMNEPAKHAKTNEKHQPGLFSIAEKENQAEVRFSNDMSDACKTICKICQKPIFLVTLRSHTRNIHKIAIDEYKKVYGNHRNAIIEKVYHKCGLCCKTILLDSDEI